MNIQINAYIFSTKVIPTVLYNASSPPANSPQYGGNLNYIGTPITWTYPIVITKRSQCDFAPAADWFVPTGSTQILPTGYVVFADASRSYDISIPKITSNADPCTILAIYELRLVDPKGVAADVVLSGAVLAAVV